MERKSILMCPPTEFGIYYEINPHMNIDNQADRKLAMQQWCNLVGIYKHLGVDVRVMRAALNLPDMVFTANAGMPIDDTVVVSNFACPERQGETRHFKRWFEEQGYKRVIIPEFRYEGQGDTLLTGDNLLQGWGYRSDGFRSSLKSVDLMKESFPEYDDMPLHLVEPKLYHLDTACLPLTSDLIYICEEAFDGHSIRLLKQNFRCVKSIFLDQAVDLGLNGVKIGEKVLLNGSKSTDRLAEMIKAEGFEVVRNDTSEFQKSGGSDKCMSLDLAA